MKKPKMIFNYDYDLPPFPERRENSVPFLLQQACGEYFDVYERGEIPREEADVIFNTLPLPHNGFLEGKVTMYWDTVPLEKIWKEYFDRSQAIFYVVPSYQSFYPRDKSHLLLPAINENYRYFPSDFAYDVGFLGSEVEAWRINLLDELEKHFKLLRGATEIGVPSAKLLSKCRLVLSVQDYHEKKVGIEYRLFTFGNVRPILVHFNLDYKHVGEPYVHYIPYSNKDDIIGQIDYYLKRKKKRETVGENLKKRLAQHHTYEKRAKKVYDVFCKITKGQWKK